LKPISAEDDEEDDSDAKSSDENGTLMMIQIGCGASARNHTIIILYVVTCVKTGFMDSVSLSPKARVRCLYIA
jgi:hypothetical protein